MADLSRTDLSRPADRTSSAGETKIEQLLLTGLDHYFAGEYERAISVWTRVLFLDRAHPRARAYIERARNAIAERQRESEELMHRGVDAFGRGDVDQARELLTTALERGGPQDVAFAFLDRLDRLQAVTDGPAPRSEPVTRTRRQRPRRPLPVRLPRQRLWLLPGFVLVVALAAAGFYLAGLGERVAPLVLPDARRGLPRAGVADAEAMTVTVPAPAEVALARARAAMATGHLKEALRTLDAVDTGNSKRAEADRLKAEIQRALLSSAGSPGGGERAKD